jgi:hypothetical protein
MTPDECLSFFRDEIARGRAHHASKDRGGQHVTPSGDFVYAQPSVLHRLEWWATEFESALATERAKRHTCTFNRTDGGGP